LKEVKNNSSEDGKPYGIPGQGNHLPDCFLRILPVVVDERDFLSFLRVSR